MRSLDDLLAASQWAAALSAEQLQRARTGIVVRELLPGNYACRKGDPSNVWVGVIDDWSRPKACPIPESP
jgi:hypothetical protein